MSIQTLVEKIKERGNPTVAGLDVRPAEILTVCVTAAVKRECVAVTTYEPRLT